MKKYTTPVLEFEAIRQKENIYLEVGVDEIYNSSTNREDYDFDD